MNYEVHVRCKKDGNSSLFLSLNMNYLRTARIYPSHLPDHCECECPNCAIRFDLPNLQKGKQILCPNGTRCKCLMAVPLDFYKPDARPPLDTTQLFAICDQLCRRRGETEEKVCNTPTPIVSSQAGQQLICWGCQQTFVAKAIPMAQAFPRPKTKSPPTLTIMSDSSDYPRPRCSIRRILLQMFLLATILFGALYYHRVRFLAGQDESMKALKVEVASLRIQLHEAEAATKAMEKYGDDSVAWLKQTVKEKLKYEFVQDKDGAWGLVPTQ